MSISEEILIIANIIANQGKKPTIALIKTKLTSSVPLPVIISTLKTWQHDPDFISLKNESSIENINNPSLGNTNKLYEEIEAALAPFKQEISKLKLEISEIKQQLKSAKKIS